MKRSKLYMLVGALLLGSLFVAPLWNITLEAPQYPDPIGMNIHINKFVGANGNDIKNINIMNHYVGMKEIPEMIPEFGIFPYVVAGMILLGIIFSFVGRRQLYIIWFALMIVFGSMAMYDFYLWEYDYGHDLKENAAIKFTDKEGNPMTYQPPLIGAKTILNFRAISMPRLGAYLMFLGMCLSLLAYFKSKKEQAMKIPLQAVLALFVFGIMSCEVKPRPISYGSDACHFCRMTIVDKQHAAQLVTKKGKVYKYDAIECMMNDLEDWDRPEVAYYLVADFANPGELTNAVEAHFLISEQIPSPMGAFLTAFANEESRERTLDTAGGELFTWSQLRNEFNVVN